MRALGQLLRLSLTASALADAAAGVLLGAGMWPGGGRPWLMLLASACVFHGGMALNDWADRHADARLPARAARPIPSGAIGAPLALVLALGLLATGPLIASSVSAPACIALTVVAATAALYDVAGRGPWLGPLLLGTCRAGNLTAGILAGFALAPTAEPVPIVAFAALPAVYGLYVFLVSRLGRLEDGEDTLERRRLGPHVLIACIGLVLVSVCVLPAPAPHDADGWFAGARRYAAFAVGVAGAWSLFRCATGRREWRTEHIMPVMGMALRRLLIYTAAVALLAGSEAGWIGAALILAGFPLSYLLRRVFPPS